MSLVDYDVLRIIGKGTYGEVHLVNHKADRKQYVIKKMALLKASPRERKAAEQEAKLLSNLRHPNIVSYKDSFESGDKHLYIVMGYAEGGDLYTKLREHRTNKDFLTEQQVVRWFIQICMALQYLHERRILHRDLKTQNIFLTKNSMIKVGDLGIARVLDNSTDMATTLIGTPYYMSPELFSNRPYNHKSDVWALGCCMYEMVTLKHAFNAKDMNSLVYKILRGKMPPMPKEYSSSLCELIEAMLNSTPEKRPSVNRILRNPFIKKHIQLFLDESSRRKRSSGRSSRASSVVSSAPSSRSASRKSSVNSQGHSSPPHPPTSIPESSRTKASPAAKNILPPAREFENLKRNQINSAQSKELKSKENSASEVAKEVDDDTGSTASESTLQATVKSVGICRDETPVRIQELKNANTNNSKGAGGQSDSGIHMNYMESPVCSQGKVQPASPRPANQISKSTAQNPTQVNDSNLPTKEDHQAPRATSASSTCSSSSRASSSSSSRRTARPLPKCPVVSSASETKKSQGDNNLHGSWESVSSVSSSVMSTEDGAQKVSSARQRRRERNRKEKEKVNTPPIIEEIRRSRNSGLMGHKYSDVEKPKNLKSQVTSTSGLEVKKKAALEASGDSVFTSDRENSGKQPEIEEFMTLLHNTLQLAGNKSKRDGDDPSSSSSSPSSTTEDVYSHGGALTPVPEGTENSYSGRSSSSQIHQLPQSYVQNTPAATPISVPLVSNQSHLPVDVRKHGVTPGTLRSTQRLMDRIVSLRRDCIQGLGVPLLHRAYEVLDANEDEDVLRDDLIELLGEIRYDQWIGKIWQLKFCEESIFGHCGSITAN